MPSKDAVKPGAAPEAPLLLTIGAVRVARVLAPWPCARLRFVMGAPCESTSNGPNSDPCTPSTPLGDETSEDEPRLVIWVAAAARTPPAMRPENALPRSSSTTRGAKDVRAIDGTKGSSSYSIRVGAAQTACAAPLARDTGYASFLDCALASTHRCTGRKRDGSIPCRRLSRVRAHAHAPWLGKTGDVNNRPRTVECGPMPIRTADAKDAIPMAPRKGSANAVVAVGRRDRSSVPARPRHCRSYASGVLRAVCRFARGVRD